MKYIASLKRFIWWLINVWQFGALGLRSYFRKSILLTKKYIYCGKHVRVRNNARIEGITKYNHRSFDPRIILDDFVSIEQNCHFTCASEIYIGKFTAIGANVTITDIHHPYEDVEIAIEKQDIVVKKVFIDEECKIYNNAVILPGVKIGKHVTIGANSVVNMDIPDFSVVAGQPARIIKYYDFQKKEWVKP